MKSEILNNGQYDQAKLIRLSKSDDFAELEKVIEEISNELLDIRNVDLEFTDADVRGRTHAYEALQQLIATVKGAEQAYINKDVGNLDYT